MLLRIILILSCFSLSHHGKAQKNHDYPITPVSFTMVIVNDNFWKPRIETNHTVTIPYDFEKCEETNRIQNFEIAHEKIKRADLLNLGISII